MFYPRVRTKNSSAKRLRREYETLPRFPIRSIIRLGSTTDTEIVFPRSYGKRVIIEINTVESIRNSRSKLLMKECFAKAKVPQADWWESIACPNFHGDDIMLEKIDSLEGPSIYDISYPILVKRIYGFKGKGMQKLNSVDELINWCEQHSSKDGWYFEQFHNYSREYRLHCSEQGCFYTCRKMLKSDAENRWFRNDSNSVWILEDNELFDKPTNWEDIERDCVKALKAVGLTVGAFDVKVQSATDKSGNKRDYPNYIIIEVNSAPSFGDITLEKYIENLPKIIKYEISKII